MRLSLNIESVGLQASPAAGFRQPDRIENANRNVVFTGGLNNFPFTRTGRRMC